MPTLKERILEAVASKPGITDAELARALGKRHQHVNAEALRLAGRGLLIRSREGDGLHNYLPTAGPPAAPNRESGWPDPATLRTDLDEYLRHREPNARYASFDYCFNYFQTYREQGRLADLLRPDVIQISCLQLGFYLASWGMYRGSADLLQRSVKHLAPVVEQIVNAPADIWEIDAHLYADRRSLAIHQTARRIERALAPGKVSGTLVTKIMLGVFGCVPAFDAYFKHAFGAATFGPKALRRVGEFYRQHAELVEQGRVHTLDFASGGNTERRYTRAKVIDMIFFTAGQRMQGGER